MMGVFWLGIFFSLGLHVFLLWTVTLEKQAEQPVSLYEVEPFPSGNRTKIQEGAKSRRLTMGDLGLGGPGGVKIGAFRVDPNSPLVKGTSEIVELGTGKGIFNSSGEREAVPEKSLKHSGFLKQLHDFIDSSLVYPREFVENDIEGKVDVVLHFDLNGHLVLERCRFKTHSNYLRVWARRHLRTLFKEPLPFAIQGKEVRVGVVLELELGLGALLGNFSKGENFKRIFTNGDLISKEDLTTVNFLSGGRLYFYRKKGKSYGVGLAGGENEGSGSFLPAVDVFAMVDRVGRLLSLSDEKVHERNLLEIMRRDPYFTKE